jgi:hypothetical protein
LIGWSTQIGTTRRHDFPSIRFLQIPGRRWLTSDFDGFSKCPPQHILTAYNIPLQLPTVTWRDTGLRATA